MNRYRFIIQMKHSFLLVAVMLSIFTSCKRNNPEPESPSAVTPPGVFVVNEGNFTAGNASLTWFQTEKKTLVPNAFYSVNKVPLGDVANFMTINNGKGYVVVNNSGIVYVIDINTGEFLGKIENLISPREIIIIDNKTAWVSNLYSKFITVVNTETYNVTGTINLKGHTSESMVKIGDKVFVANWSKLNQQLTNDKLLVIDVVKNSVVDSIQVTLEPNSMVVDKNGKLWVLCSGGYSNEIVPALYQINPETDAIEQKIEFSDKTDSPINLVINGEGTQLYYINYGIYKMDITSTQIPDEPLIQSGSKNFYSLAIEPDSNNIFVSDALDYARNGRVYIYNKSGDLTSQFEAGIIPGYFAFYLE